MGPEIAELEQKLADYCGVREVISCSSGTDALWLPLLARSVGPDDAVFLPSFTFTATAEAVALTGATPVFVDVQEHDFNVDPDSLVAAIADIDAKGELTPRGIISVDLFGQPADYPALRTVADRHDLWLLDDAAQSFGATHDGKKVGSLADVTATSFFPAKPLGCYGDGGAIFTDDADLAEIMRSIRVHGRGTGKYDNVRIGTNARLDTMQAAILLQKLSIFDDELTARDRVARRYRDGLADVVRVPVVRNEATTAWAQYVIMTENRDRVQEALRRDGIPTQIYYPKPLHAQTAYGDYPIVPGGLPVSERLTKLVLALPMHPYLDEPTQDRIIAGVREAATAA